MKTFFSALALLSGVIGAGFASGREIAHFFADYGKAAPIAACSACLTLLLLFGRLPAQMTRFHAKTLPAYCRLRFGQRFGRLCAGLFALLCAMAGGAMLAACAEIAALTLHIHGAYALGLIASLLLSMALCRRALAGLALPGALLCALLPVLLLSMLRLPAGEASFLPLKNPLKAAASGVCYAALNAAMLSGALALLPRDHKARMRVLLLFLLLFTALLALGVLVLLRHRQAAYHQPLPFVYLSGQLGKRGYLLCAGSLYFAALSTLCAMLASLRHLWGCGVLLPALTCLLFACIGFGDLVSRGYPMLGMLCAGLMALLCLPGQKESSSSR